MQKNIKYIVVIAILSMAGTLQAQVYNSAVGARLGTFFTGSYKTFISESNALEAVVGFDGYGGRTSLLAGAFFQLHNDLNLDGAEFQWYYGFGGYVLLGDATGIAPSGIVGLEYTLKDAPVNFFIDAIPTLFLVSGASDFQINGSLGARYILNY